MKKIFKSKKWIAFFLALLLVVSTSITSSDAFLWATEGYEEEEKDAPADNGTNVVLEKDVTDSDEQQDEEDSNEEDSNEEDSDEEDSDKQDEEDSDKQDEEDSDKQDQEDSDEQDQEDSDELIEEDQPIEGELEEEILDGVALFAAAPLAEYERTLELVEGATGQATCSRSGEWFLSHTWESDNEGVATVDKNGNVKAVGKGLAVVKCYSNKISGGKEIHCQWFVEVSPKVETYTATDTKHAYGYLEVTGADVNDSGCMDVVRKILDGNVEDENPTPGNGWYRLGRVEAELPEITLTVEGENNTFSPAVASSEDFNQVKQKFNTDLFDVAKEIVLKPENGTDDGYGIPVVGEGGQLTWHFDVHVNVSKMYCTIKYVDQNGEEITNVPENAPRKVWDLPGTVISADEIKPDIPGYKYVNNTSNSITINKETAQVLTLTYKDNTTNYKVEHYYEEKGQYPSNAGFTETKEAEVGDTVTWNPEIESIPEGYAFDEDAAGNWLEDTIEENQETVLKVYFKQQFTVEYEVDGKIVEKIGSLDYNAATPTIDDPKKEGNAFVGWCKKGTDVVVKDITNIPVTEDVTYVAKWGEASNLYTYVKFIMGGEDVALSDTELTALEGYFGLDVAQRWTEGGRVWYPIGRIKDYPKAKPVQTTPDDKQAWSPTKTSIEQGWSSGMDAIKLKGTTEEEKIAYKDKIWEKIGSEWYADSVAGANGFYEFEEARNLAEGGSYVWHLNGTVDLEKPVSVKYVDENGIDIAEEKINGLDKEITYAIFRTINTGDDKVVKKGEIEGYRYSNAWITVDNVIQTNGNENAQQYSIGIDDENKKIAIVLQYEKTYQVTYKAGDGGYLTADASKTEFVDSNLHAENATVTVEADSLFTNGNTNLVFAEWEAKDSAGKTITINNGTFTMPNSNVIITAKWKGLDASKRVTSTPKDGKNYKLDEPISFVIEVKNSGDVDLQGVIIREKLEGAIIEEVNIVDKNGADVETTVGTTNPNEENPGRLAQTMIGKLPAGGTVTAKVSYVVQEKDLGNDHFKNTAKVEADGLEYNISTPDGEIPMDEVDEQLYVTKKLVREEPDDETSAPMGATGENNTFKIDETATFEITVTNAGNKTLTNITIAEALDGAVLKEVGNVVTKLFRSVEENDDGSFTIDELKPGKTVKFTATYQIKDTDPEKSAAEKANFKNVLDVTRTIGGTTDTVQVESDSVIPLAELYTLTVQYVYSDGTTAATTVTEKHYVGDSYTINTPVIAGYNSTVYYNSSIAAVTGTMPRENVVIRVVYSVPATTGGGGGGGGGDDTPTTPPTPPIDATLTQPIVIPDIPVPAGAIQVEVPADLVAIGEEEVPLQGARIDIDEDGNVDVTPIDEEEIPLAGIADSPVLHCILHILLMLAAVIIFLYHVVSTQRRQKKLDDLRDQLGEM